MDSIQKIYGAEERVLKNKKNTQKAPEGREIKPLFGVPEGLNTDAVLINFDVKGDDIRPEYPAVQPDKEKGGEEPDLFTQLLKNGFFDDVKKPDTQEIQEPELETPKTAQPAPEMKKTAQPELETPKAAQLTPEKQQIAQPLSETKKIQENISAVNSGKPLEQPEVLEAEFRSLAEEYNIEVPEIKAIFEAGLAVIDKIENQESVETLNNRMQNRLAAVYNPAAGKKLGRISENIARKRNRIGECLKYVNNALEAAYGKGSRIIKLNPNNLSAYHAAEGLRLNKGVGRHFTEVEADRSVLDKLPAGTIVVWDKSAGHKHGHIAIALGNGLEASDHIQKQSSRKGVNYWVFAPNS